jgi:hypothetical protein
MTQMQQVLVGGGKLSDEAGAEHAVQFKFEFTQELIPGPSGQTALGKARQRGAGRVTADDGQPIGDGIYWLAGSDGRQWRVQRLGMQWFLLSPPTG